MINENAIDTAVAYLYQYGIHAEGSEKFIKLIADYQQQLAREESNAKNEAKILNFLEGVNRAKYLAYVSDHGYLKHAIKNTDEFKTVMNSIKQTGYRFYVYRGGIRASTLCGLKTGTYSRTGLILGDGIPFEELGEGVCNKCASLALIESQNNKETE